MLERYTLSTTRFPSQFFDETGCDYFLFPTPGKKDHITIDIHYLLEHHAGIHTKEVDLLDLRKFNDLPSWYPFFHLPYQIDVKVTCTGFYVYVEIIYIDLSPDPETLSPYVYSKPSDETIWRLYGIPSKENYISDYIVKIDKSLQFQVNRLNIARDTSIKARPKNSSQNLNFCIPSITLTLI